MKVLSATLAMAMWLGSSVLGASNPPTTALPLSKVLTTLEAGGYRGVTDIDFDDGQWHIELMRGDVPVEIHVDPSTAKVVYEERDEPQALPPADAKPLTETVKRLEDAGRGAITEIDFEGAAWKVEALRGGVRYESFVDLRSGDILSERVSND